MGYLLLFAPMAYSSNSTDKQAILRTKHPEEEASEEASVGDFKWNDYEINNKKFADNLKDNVLKTCEQWPKDHCPPHQCQVKEDKCAEKDFEDFKLIKDNQKVFRRERYSVVYSAAMCKGKFEDKSFLMNKNFKNKLTNVRRAHGFSYNTVNLICDVLFDKKNDKEDLTTPSEYYKYEKNSNFWKEAEFTPKKEEKCRGKSIEIKAKNGKLTRQDCENACKELDFVQNKRSIFCTSYTYASKTKTWWWGKEIDKCFLHGQPKQNAKAGNLGGHKIKKYTCYELKEMPKLETKAELVMTKGGKSCVFPFTHKKIDYYGCTTVNYRHAWCATETNVDGSHKKWDICVDQANDKGAEDISSSTREKFAGINAHQQKGKQELKGVPPPVVPPQEDGDKEGDKEAQEDGDKEAQEDGDKEVE